jgi:hypothetical protein
MKTIVIIITLMALFIGPAQVEWNKTSDWQLYLIRGHSVFNYSTCKLEGVTRKMEISNRGGFLYDESTGTFYQVQDEKASAWTDYLHNSYSKFINGKADSAHKTK